MTLAAILGYLVKTEREARGVNQKELAAVASLHPMALSKIERGAHKDLGVSTLDRLARALSRYGQPIQGGDLLLKAERIRNRLLEKAKRGELPEPYQPQGSGAATGVGVVLAGAALAAAIVWLASTEE